LPCRKIPVATQYVDRHTMYVVLHIRNSRRRLSKNL
jgi:hypothetical protein